MMISVAERNAITKLIFDHDEQVGNRNLNKELTDAITGSQTPVDCVIDLFGDSDLLVRLFSLASIGMIRLDDIVEYAHEIQQSFPPESGEIPYNAIGLINFIHNTTNPATLDYIRSVVVQDYITVNGPDDNLRSLRDIINTEGEDVAKPLMLMMAIGFACYKEVTKDR